MKHHPRKVRSLVVILLAIMTLFGGAVNSLYAAAAAKKIMVIGDSLVAGYGIPYSKAFPAQLEEKLQAEGFNVSVINAGVSGETTSGGVTRLDWTLAQTPDAVILEFGGNDMLRGVDPAVTKTNLDRMLATLGEKHIPVLLAGMKPFANLGPGYAAAYDEMYKSLAAKYGAVYYPFFLDGVALHKDLQLDDGMHPTPEGVAVIVERILPSVKGLLAKQR